MTYNQLNNLENILIFLKNSNFLTAHNASYYLEHLDLCLLHHHIYARFKFNSQLTTDTIQTLQNHGDYASNKRIILHVINQLLRRKHPKFLALLKHLDSLILMYSEDNQIESGINFVVEHRDSVKYLEESVRFYLTRKPRFRKFTEDNRNDFKLLTETGAIRAYSGGLHVLLSHHSLADVKSYHARVMNEEMPKLRENEHYMKPTIFHLALSYGKNKRNLTIKKPLRYIHYYRTLVGYTWFLCSPSGPNSEVRDEFSLMLTNIDIASRIIANLCGYFESYDDRVNSAMNAFMFFKRDIRNERNNPITLTIDDYFLPENHQPKAHK